MFALSLRGFLEINFFADSAVRTAPVVGNLLPAGARWKAFPGITFGLVVDVLADGASIGGRHAAAPYLATSFSRSRGCRWTFLMSPSYCCTTPRCFCLRHSGGQDG